jgi:hypothetical protein
MAALAWLALEARRPGGTPDDAEQSAAPSLAAPV